MKSLIGMERQAFGLTDGDDGAPPVQDVETDRREERERGMALEERLREALARRS